MILLEGKDVVDDEGRDLSVVPIAGYIASGEYDIQFELAAPHGPCHRHRRTQVVAS